MCSFRLKVYVSDRRHQLVKILNLLYTLFSKSRDHYWLALTMSTSAAVQANCTQINTLFLTCFMRQGLRIKQPCDVSSPSECHRSYINNALVSSGSVWVKPWGVREETSELHIHTLCMYTEICHCWGPHGFWQRAQDLRARFMEAAKMTKNDQVLFNLFLSHYAETSCNSILSYFPTKSKIASFFFPLLLR